MARFTLRWQAGTLESCDLMLRPVTGKAASTGIQSPQGIALTVFKEGIESQWPQISADTDEDSIRAAKMQVGACDGLKVTGEMDSAGFTDG